MNTVENSWYDKKHNYGSLDLNGKPVQVLRVDSDKWDEKNCRCLKVYGVRLAPDWNMSGGLWLTARTLKELVKKLERYSDRLVKPAY